MNNLKQIKEILPQLQHEFDWGHSFIRELYFMTSHCFSMLKNSSGEDCIGDADAPLNLRLMVAAAGNANFFGIEFLFKEVKVFSLQKLDELKFRCRFDENNMTVCDFANTQINSQECYVVSKNVYVAFYGEEYLGPRLKLGYEFPDKEAITAIKLEGDWRQCSSCFNAWEERSDVSYSRCTECGQLTRLS